MKYFDQIRGIFSGLSLEQLERFLERNRTNYKRNNPNKVLNPTLHKSLNISTGLGSSGTDLHVNGENNCDKNIDINSSGEASDDNTGKNVAEDFLF